MIDGLDPQYSRARRLLLQLKLNPALGEALGPEIEAVVHRTRAGAFRDAAGGFDAAVNGENRLLRTAAEKFETVWEEFASRPTDESTSTAELLTGILSGLCYEAARLPSNSRLMFGEVFHFWREFQRDRVMEEDPLNALEDGVQSLIIALFLNDLRTSREGAGRLLAQLDNMEAAATARFDAGEYTRGDLAHFAGLTLLLRGLEGISRELLASEVQAQPADLGYFRAASDLYERVGDSGYWLLASLLGVALREKSNAGTAKALRPVFRTEQERRYVHSLLSLSRQVYQLWPSQLAAIRGGLFEPDLMRAALSFPTSAGKTLIAETVIARELLRDPEAKCIYLAPTRALVTEVERTLKRSLKPLGIDVTQVSPAAELSPVDERLAFENRLVCLTPEKLDTFLRMGHELLNTVRLIVVDEGHLLEEQERGELLEFAMIKLQMRFPETKVLFLSAVIPNIEEIASWLGAQEKPSRPIRSNWRPTRLRIAEAFVESVSEASAHEVEPWQALGPKVLRYCKVRYLDGEEVIPFVVRRGEASKFNTNEAIVAALARAYAQRGNTMVLTMSKPRAESLAEGLCENLPATEDERLENLASKIEREVDPGFPLAAQVRRGVAYHHADLPPRIRYQLEAAAREGKLRHIIATPTLAEGVNLPVSTLIVDDLNIRYLLPSGKWGGELMSARKFWNLAGRAGRALVDTEGHVIVMLADRFFKNAEEKKKYLNPEISSLEPVRSVFLQLIDFLEKFRHHLVNFDFVGDPFSGYRPVQNFLLAILDLADVMAIDLDEDAAVSRIVKHALITYQSQASPANQTHFRSFVRWGIRTARTYLELPIERRRLIVRLGLPISSATKLIALLDAKPIDELYPMLAIRENGTLNAEMIEALYSVAFELEEIRPKVHTELPHARIAQQWITGRTIREVATAYFHDEKRPLAEASNYLYRAQAMYGAWGISAVVGVIGHILHAEGAVDDPELRTHEIAFLPAYSSYGVDSPVAAGLAARGVERLDARVLAEWFYQETGMERGYLPEPHIYTDWLKGIETDDLIGRVRQARGSFDAELIETISNL